MNRPSILIYICYGEMNLMVERKDKTPENLSDLPNFKEKFTEPLEGIGIASVTDLQEALKDDSKTSSILDISGVGPKTVESWRNMVNGSSTIDNVSAMDDQEEIVEEKKLPSRRKERPLATMLMKEWLKNLDQQGEVQGRKGRMRVKRR